MQQTCPYTQIMNVALIPLIEIFHSHPEITPPASGPFWEYTDEWEQYNRANNIRAGLSDNLKPYLKGSSLYNIDGITDSDLLKLIQKEIEVQQTEENSGIEDLVCSFSGGYVLRIDHFDKYFPQCCGDLADLEAWESLVHGAHPFFYPGHPYPRVTATGDKLRFDFANTTSGEHFAPPVPDEVIDIDKSALQKAIAETKSLLQRFAERLKTINKTAQLNIPDIDKRLIWGKTT